MLEEDAPDLLDDLGLSLTRVVPPHDQLGDHPVDVSAPVGHDAVVPSACGPSPLTAMIECAGIRDDTGMDVRMRRPGLRGLMLSIAVGGRRRVAISSASPVDATASASPPNTATGMVMSRAASAPSRCPAWMAPWWGVATNTTRSTKGRG